MLRTNGHPTSNSGSKRYYNIDDIINDAKPSKRQPLADATNFCLPPPSRTDRADRADRADGAQRSHRGDHISRLIESLLPCRKISLPIIASLPIAHTATDVIPDVYAFPQRPIGSLEVLDAGSLRERHCDWCEAFRSAYQKGCRLYVTHSTFAAVFWADRGMAVMARPTPGFKVLMRSFGIVFEEVRGEHGKEYIVVGDVLGGDGGDGVHGLYDMILNEVVGVGTMKKRKDIHKGDFPRLYCEEAFRHSSAVAWAETYDRRRREVVGYLPAWVLEGLEKRTRGEVGEEGEGGKMNMKVRGYEKLLDL